jgi:hypothetical protein
MKDIEKREGRADWLDSLDRKLGQATGKPVAATLRAAEVRRAGGSEQLLFFRCARSGEPFSVTMARESSAERFRITAITKVPAAAGRAGAAAARPENMTFEAAQMDFAGWQCPHCRHEAAPSFIQCAKCRQLVCGGTVIQIANGGRTFRCEPGCGGSGTLSGDIAAYQTERRPEEAGARTSTAPGQRGSATPLPKQDRPLLIRGK